MHVENIGEAYILWVSNNEIYRNIKNIMDSNEAVSFLRMLKKCDNRAIHFFSRKFNV